ncbi:MAG: beta-galactosidase BgaS [Nitrososphaeria archaeon]
MRKNSSKFPEKFIFGFSEAGFQFEMGLPGSEDPNSDWWQWVHDPDNILSGLVSGDLPEDGPAYWHLYKQDHDLACYLGMRGARLGIEWSRIFPKPTFEVKVPVEEDEEGNILSIEVDEKALEQLDKLANKEAVEHYRKIFEDWKNRGNYLIINLYHWPLPLWIHDAVKVRKFGPNQAPAGWVDKRTTVEFVKFAAYIAWKLGDLPDSWSTMNEPNVVYVNGYINLKAGFPPAYPDFEMALKAKKFMAEAHARAYDVLKKLTGKTVGIIYAMRALDPLKPDNKECEEALEKARAFETYNFLDAIILGKSQLFGNRPDLASHVDWIGVNYYTRRVIEPAENILGYRFAEGYGNMCVPKGLSKDGRPCTDAGYEFYPEGLYNVLIELWERYKPLPLIITENGLADSEDMLRPIYLSSHLYQLLRALKTGVDVKGYLYWAVTDNYEWSSGYKMRFGLAKVDYKTKKRILRPSSLIFKEIAENKELPFDM